MVNIFKEGVSTYMPVWEKIMEEENCEKIKEVAKLENSHFELPNELWIKSLFDFVLAFKKQSNGLRHDEIIEALVPLYYAKVASFVRKTQNLDSHQAEEVINQQCSTFEKLKPYLISRWT
jgi:hypothetical protein